MDTEIIGYDEVVGDAEDEMLDEMLEGDFDDDDEVGALELVGATRRRRIRRRRAKLVGTLMAGIPPTTIPDGETRTVKINVADPFRPDFLVLSDAAQGLLIRDIRVGTVSQNVSGSPVPGSVYQHDSVQNRMSGSTAAPGVGVDIICSNTSGSDIVLSGAFFGRAVGK